MKSPPVTVLSNEEWNAREEKRVQYKKEYYSKPEIKQRQSKYYKKYNQVPVNKEDHRKSEARYRQTAKGKACDVRAWKKYNAKTRDNKEDSNDYPDIAV